MKYFETVYQHVMQRSPLGPQQHYSQYNIPMPYSGFNWQGPSGIQHPISSFVENNQQQSQLVSTPPPPQPVNKAQIHSMHITTSESQSGIWAHQGPILAVNSQSGNYLPSSAIPQHSLKSVKQVLHENYKLCTEATAGTLCQVLAKEAIFGKELMEQCTPNGAQDCPGLPRQELNNLKATMFHLFPRFQSCPE